MGKIKFLVRNRWPLLSLFFCSVIPLLWFKKGSLLAGGDEIEYLNPGNSFGSYFYAWLDKFNAGGPNFNLYSVFPFKFFWFFFQLFGFSNLLIERLWVVLLFILPGISMYFLCSFLFRNFSRTWKNLTCLTSSTFYLFNIFAVLNPIQFNTRLVFFALPICLLFWLKALNSGSFNVRYPIYIGLISVLITAANANLPLVSIIPMTLFLYGLFFLLIEKGSLKKVIFYGFSSLVIYLVLNIWWITNLYFLRLEGLESNLKEFIKESSFLDVTPVWESLRLMGYWAFRQNYNGKPLIQFAKYYYQLPLLFCTLLVPVIVFSPLSVKKKEKKLLFFLVAAAIGVFLAKGVQPPFGNFYKFIMDKIPYFWIYRNPYSKFTVLTLFSYSVLLGYFFVSTIKPIQNHLSKTKLNLLSVLLAVLLFIPAYPLFTGEIFLQKQFESRKSVHAKVPDYWNEASEWFKQNDPDSRILLLPKAAYGMSYSWSSGVSGSAYVANFLLPNDLIEYLHLNQRGTEFAVKSLYDNIMTEDKENLTNILRVFNIKYILHQGDLYPEGLYFKPQPYEVVKKYLANKDGIQKVKSFGQLDLYQVSEFQDKKIFASGDFELALNYQTLFEQLAGQNIDISLKPAFLLEKLRENEKNLIFSGNSVREFYFLGFSGLSVCQKCSSGIGLDYIYLSTADNGIEKIFGRNKGALAVEIKVRNFYQNRFLITATFPAEEFKTLIVDTPWDVTQKGVEWSIFETSLPEEFPDYLVSDKNTGRYFLVFHNGQVMTRKILGEALLGPEETVLGSISPRRLVVSTVGQKPGGEYKIVYLNQVPADPLASEKLETKFVYEGKIPQLAVKKVNPTKYEVQVNNAISPFFLTFLESFSPYWRAMIEEEGKKETLRETNHFQSYGYANTWFLDKKGNYKISLYYLPQQYLSAAFGVSFCSLITLILVLILSRGKQRSEKVADKMETFIPKGQFGEGIVLLTKVLIAAFLITISFIVFAVAFGKEKFALQVGVIAFVLLLAGVFFNIVLLILPKDYVSKN